MDRNFTKKCVYVCNLRAFFGSTLWLHVTLIAKMFSKSDWMIEAEKPL